ncbi:uncharacterized protein [Rutidosis leptorrhynchoides]|uniref:uncharacterized protein isoform X2 n=1 Tax=Rutidosis leptorrhynchoides TaxID=125765 RepID=UPI003A993C74
MTESVTTCDVPPDTMAATDPKAAEQPKFVSRKEKRKSLKKEKRKQIRKEIAEKSRAEEEARMNDPEEQRKIEEEEEREKERLERERKEFEERERKFLEDLEMKKKKQQQEEEEEQMNAAETELKEGVEEGNEIIVKKNKVKVKKKDIINQVMDKEDTNRPTSNPLPPQSDAYAAYKNAPITSADLLDTVAQQVPNFGTEQDKAHCPFHIKTGACRFGSRCNRVHYYPDKSTTLLIKNMYNGPGLAWEQDEGLEYTDEEVELSFEDFYEDVHTEFLKFGEIVNFKVCRNGSFHLRGNVYVHYKSLDSAVMAYNSVNGRYFAGKQVTCEFVSLSRWKVAICGEYIKSRLKTCSRGSACNFLHCFSNPGGDYEWADCDKPPPRYWVKKMIALFGYSDDTEHSSPPKDRQHSNRIDRDHSYHYKRHHSVETDRGHHDGDCVQKSRRKREDDERSLSRHRYSSKSRSRHNRRDSKSRDYYGTSRTPRSSSSDDELYKEKQVKRKSRHRKKVAESYSDEGSDDAKHEFSEHKSNSSSRYRHQRSRRHNHDEDIDEVDIHESKNELLTKKLKKHNVKSTTDKDVERHRRHKEHRSRSRDIVCILDENETSDRWDPNSSPNEHVKDHHQILDYKNLKGERSSRETRPRSFEEESKVRDDRMKENRKRI